MAQVAADPRPAACRRPTAAGVRLLQGAAVRLWSPESSASASGQEQAMRSAREKSAAVRPWYPVRPASVLGREWAMPWVKKAAAARLWFPERPVSVLGQE